MMNLNTLIDLGQITGYITTGLTIAFWVILALLVVALLKGLFHGWRYGLYKILCFAVVVLVLMLCLEPIANFVSTINLANFGLSSLSLSLPNSDGSSTTIVVAVSTLGDTLENLLEQVLMHYGTTLEPAALTEYCMAFAASLIKLVLLLAYGLVIIPLLMVFFTLLWMCIFRWCYKKRTRKKKLKKGRWVGALSSFVITLVTGALLLFPLSAMVNTINSSVEKEGEEAEKLKADNTTYSQVVDVLEAYDNSLFAQVFFNWSSGENGTFDKLFIEALTRSTFGETTVSFLGELSSIASIASNLIMTGFDMNSTQGEMIATIATSSYTPAVLYSLADSQLITTLLPYAFQIALHIDPIDDYLLTAEGIDTTSEEWVGTFEQLGDLYQAILNSGSLEGLSASDDGNLNYDTNYILDLFTNETRREILEVFNSLDNGEWALLENIIDAFCYVSCANEVKNPSTGEELTLGIADFMPASTFEVNDEGVPLKVTDEFKNIKWGEQLTIIYDFVFNAVEIDRDFLTNLLASAIDNVGEMDLSPVLSFVANHPREIKELLVGDVSKINAATGHEDENTTCLFDSDLVINGLDKVLKVLGNTITDSLSSEEGGPVIDLDPTIDELEDENRVQAMINYKVEFDHLIDVAVEFLEGHPAAVALMEDFENHPGIYIDPNNQIKGIEDDLYDALIDAVYAFDESKIATAILPPCVEYYLEESDLVTSLLGEEALPLDFQCDNLGGELASLLEGVKVLDPYLSDLTSLGSGADVSSLLELLDVTVNDEGQEVSLISYLLNLISDSKIFNPDTVDENGVTVINTNYALLIETIFSFTETDIGFNIADFQNIDVHLENQKIGDFLVDIDKTGLIDVFLGDTANVEVSTILRTLTSISREDFISIFAEIDESFILDKAMTVLFDESFVNSLFGEGSGVSFNNITSWEEEGDGLYSLMVFANEIGDLNNIDFFNSDPEAIEGILKCCATSQLFMGTDENGQPDYLFPEFIYSKLSESISGTDAASFLEGTSFNYTGKQGFEVVEGEEFKILEENVLALDTPEKWEVEAEHLCEVIREIQGLGGFDALDNITSLSAARIESLIGCIANSDAFGHLLITNIYITIRDTLADAFDNGDGTSPIDNANIGYVYDNYTSNRSAFNAELTHLYELLDAALNPTFGIIQSGSVISDFNITSLNGEHLVYPLLSSLAQSQVFNSLYDYNGASNRTQLTAFEGIVSKTLYDAQIYGSNYLKEDVDALVISINPTLDPTSYGSASVHNWEDEITSIVDSIELLDDCGFITADGDVDMSPLSNLSNYFKGSASEVLRKKTNLKALLSEMDESALLFEALATQIDANVSVANIPLTGLSIDRINFDYRDPTRGFGYGYSAINNRKETDVLVDVLEAISRVDGSSFQNTDQLIELLVYLHGSHIFNTKVVGEATTFFQDALITILGDQTLEGYIYNASNPKVQHLVSQYNLTINDESDYVSFLVSTYYFNSEVNGNYAIDDDATYLAQVSLINDPNSGLGQALEVITPLVGGGKLSLTDLNSTEVYDLLNAMNRSDLLADMVPNILDVYLEDAQADYGQTSGLDFSLATPFFSYYYNEGADLLDYNSPDWSRRYPVSEIEAISECVVGIYANSSILDGSDSLNYISPLDVRDILYALSESFVFHKGGPNTNSPTYNPVRSQIDMLPNDLTVLEQLLFTFYDNKGFDQFFFDEIEDALYLLTLESTSGAPLVTDLDEFLDRSSSSRTGADTLYYDLSYKSGIAIGGANKIYDSIKSLRDLTSNEMVHEEILALTTGIDGSGKGFIQVWQDTGLSSSSLQNVSDLRNRLSSMDPDSIHTLFDAINELRFLPGLVSYQADYLVNEEIGFKIYSMVDVDLTSHIRNGVISLSSTEAGQISTIRLTLSGTVQASDLVITLTGKNRDAYSYQLSDAFSLVDGSTNEYVADLAKYGAYGFFITLPTGVSLTSGYANVDSSDFYYRALSSDLELRVRYENYGIPILVEALTGLIDPNASGDNQYLSFDATRADGLLEAIETVSSSVVLKFLGATGGFYSDLIYMTSSQIYTGRSITLINLLDIEQTLTVENIPYVILLPISDYFGETDVSAHDNVEAIFSALEAGTDGASYEKEGVYLDAMLPSLIALKGEVEVSKEVAALINYGGYSDYLVPAYFYGTIENSVDLQGYYASFYPVSVSSSDNSALDSAVNSLLGRELYEGLSMDILTMNASYAVDSLRASFEDNGSNYTWADWTPYMAMFANTRPGIWSVYRPSLDTTAYNNMPNLPVNLAGTVDSINNALTNFSYGTDYSSVYSDVSYVNSLLYTLITSDISASEIDELINLMASKTTDDSYFKLMYPGYMYDEFARHSYLTGNSQNSTISPFVDDFITILNNGN